MSTPLIETKHLKKYFDTPRGKLHAVDDISISIERGKTLGIVGESGCGKTTLGRVLLRLIPATSGQVFYNGEDILSYDRHQMKEMRKKMQIIFQDPFSSLNPRLSVTNLIAEPMKVCKTVKTRAELQDRVKELMQTVGLAERLVNTYPHELDGGRRQRIGVARALAVNPEIDYVEVKVKSDEQTIILAKNAIKYLGDDKEEVIRAFKGEELVGLHFETCFPEFDAQKDIDHKIVAWEDVDAEEGTGVVPAKPQHFCREWANYT